MIVDFCNFQDYLDQPFVRNWTVKNAVNSNDISIFKVITKILRHWKRQLITGTFIHKPVCGSTVILIDVATFEIDTS